MGSSGEKQGVKLDRSVSSAGSSAKARKIKDRPHVRKPFKLYLNKNCRHNRNPVFGSPVFPTKSTTSLKLKSSSEICYSWCSTCSTGRSSNSVMGAPTLESSITQLSSLLNMDKITMEQTMRALKKFQDYNLRIRWLKLNLDKQIEYVKSLGDQGNGFIQGSGSNQQKSKSLREYS